MNRRLAQWFLMSLMPIIGLTACSRIPEHLRPAKTVPLDAHNKADVFQSSFERDFITAHGLVRPVIPVVEGKPRSLDTSIQTEVTALGLMAEVHRFRSTGNLDAIYNIDKLLTGIELCFEITSIPGYPATAVAPSEQVDPSWRWNSADVDRRSDDPLTQFHWRGDASRATVSAVCLALVEVHRHLGDFPRIRERVKGPLTAMADHVHASVQSIVGLHGQITRNGDLYTHVSIVPGVIDFPIGVNALNALAIQAAAYEVSGSSRFKTRMLELVRNDVLLHLVPHRFEPNPFAEPKVERAAITALGVLIRSPTLPRAFCAPIIEAAKWSWSRLDDRRNVYTAAVLAPIFEGDPYQGSAASVLGGAPDDRRVRELDLSGLGPEKFLSDEADEDLPLAWRGSSIFIWHDHPRQLHRHIGLQGDYASSPVDYLCAYWLCRAEGWITAPEADARH